MVVGGANGIGLAIATELAKRDKTKKVYIIDKSPLSDENRLPKMESYQCDLTGNDFSIFDKLQDIDGLMITAGFGRLALFKDVPESMIATYFNVNTIGVIRVIKHYYDKLFKRRFLLWCNGKHCWFYVISVLLALWGD